MSGVVKKEQSAIARADASGGRGLAKTGRFDAAVVLRAMQRHHETAEASTHHRIGVDGVILGHG
jgi:hypothetical protein